MIGRGRGGGWWVDLEPAFEYAVFGTDTFHVGYPPRSRFA